METWRYCETKCRWKVLLPWILHNALTRGSMLRRIWWMVDCNTSYYERNKFLMS